MNKARIIGIIILIIGFYLMYFTDKTNSGFLIGALNGVVIGVGFAITAFGKIKFWNKI